MIYLYAFLVSGAFALIAQIIYDRSKLTPGHITSMFLVFGAILSACGVYQYLLDFAGGGASVPITNFGNLLVEGGLEGLKEGGLLGMLLGLLTKCSATLGFTIFIATFASIVAKPRQ